MRLTPMQKAIASTPPGGLGTATWTRHPNGWMLPTFRRSGPQIMQEARALAWLVMRVARARLGR